MEIKNDISRRLQKAGDRITRNPMTQKVLESNSLVFTFLRSMVSSQAASWVDMGMSFLLFAWAHMTPWVSTALGAVAGGIVNCIINYKFTFHADGCSWRAVILKYTMVWIGSLLLNAFGTQALYALLTDWSWLEELGFRPDGYFAAARLIASLIVSWAWNFLLQRYFVYRVTRFDPYAIKAVDMITFHHSKQ